MKTNNPQSKKFLSPPTTTTIPRAITTTEWTTVTKQDELENIFFEWNKKHFSQAKNNIFLCEPLVSLCGFDGVTPFTKGVLQGTANLSSFPQPVQDILTELKQQAPSLIFRDKTDDEIQQGYHKWPERTTTSPSGRHLGHYKALFTPITDSATAQTLAKSPTQKDIFHFVCDTYRLIRKHQRPVSRWLTLWNIIMKKDPNDTRIHRHRNLHIGEADKNLEQKQDIAYELMHHAEMHHALEDETHGGRKGRQALDVAWLAVLAINQAYHSHNLTCIFFNDMQACYDRIIESVANMSLRALGSPTQPLILHANIKKSCRYHPVTGMGVSERANQSSAEDPFLGAGQGDGDASARWLAISCAII